MTGTAKASRAMDRKHAGRSWGSLCMQWAIFCCLTFALLLLAGCGGGNENEKSGGVKPGGNGILGGGAEEDVGGAEDFYGCWEYQYADEWLYVRDDGTYMWYDADGYSHEGSYTVSGETLLLDGNGLSYVVRDGGIVDDYGNLMFRSVLPDVDGTALLGAEGFFGCWEGTSGGVWLTIFDDGTYEWMWDDGYGAAGSYYMEDGVLCLQSGTRFTLDEESGFIESEDDVMFPSQLPANLQ